MSGMLPGVECARRRRLHNSSSSRDFTNRSSLCLYTTRNLQPPNSSSPLLERSMVNQTDPDENLGAAALQAKRRLDEKFAAHLRAENTPQSKSLFRCFAAATQILGTQTKLR